MYIHLFILPIAALLFNVAVYIAYKYGRKTASEEMIAYLDEVREKSGLEKKITVAKMENPPPPALTNSGRLIVEVDEPK